MPDVALTGVSATSRPLISQVPACGSAIGSLVPSLGPAVDGLGVVTFTASTQHPEVVSYEVRVWDDPQGGSPVASQNIGKPTPNGSNQILVDMTPLFETLDPGNYLVSVASIDDQAVAYDSEVSSAFSLPLA
jgi:hypothetical protein